MMFRFGPGRPKAERAVGCEVSGRGSRSLSLELEECGLPISIYYVLVHVEEVVQGFCAVHTCWSTVAEVGCIGRLLH